ncbi:MAG: nucleotidyltransferase domain-containing protein [Bacteroidales bacterium]|nr:nucleotidyltransferase domain-containing protein [Bacteroidales bacterium]
MQSRTDILVSIRQTIKSVEPSATIILYGSTARGDFRSESDIDLLILLDKKVLSREDKKRIKYPLYDIEIETGKIISPLVLSRQDWKLRHRITPFYETVSKEGVQL